MGNHLSQITRYGVVGMIWLGVLLLGIFTVVWGTGDAVIGIAIAGFITATIATGFIMQHKSDDEEAAPRIQAAGKRKNDQGGVDPMSLLTEDDIAELRAEMKDQLRRRMFEDSETSFEDLLDKASGTHKRR